MSYSPDRITAAAHAVHNNYSETPWENADYGDRTWAEGTVRAVIEKLGDSQEHEYLIERHEEVRAQNLALQEALTKIWAAAGRNSAEGFGTDPTVVHQAVLDAIEAARTPREEIEVTDEMINEIGLGFFGPAVVYDREKLRQALANALQTR